MSTASVLVPIEYSRIMHAATRFASSLRIRRLKKCAHESCRFIRDANDFVRCLAIEFEIEFRFRPIVVPVAKTLQFAAPEAPPGERSAPNSNSAPRRLPGDPAFLRYRFGRSDDAARNETCPAFVLTRENKDYIARLDVLPTVRRLLSGERERSRLRIDNRSFDRKRHFCPALTSSQYSSQNAETFFRPELRRTSKSSARVSG